MKTYILILISMILISCGSTKKTVTSHMVKNDSSAEHSITKTGISESNNTVLNQKDSSFESSIILTFESEDDSVPASISAFIKETEQDPVQKAIDLAGPQKVPVKKAKQYNYNIGGTPIKSDVPIKSATLHTGGKVTALNVVSVNNKDSGQLHEETKTHVIAETKDTEKHVTRSGWPWWIWALIIVTSTGTYLSYARKKVWFPFGSYHPDSNKTEL